MPHPKLKLVSFFRQRDLEKHSSDRNGSEACMDLHSLLSTFRICERLFSKYLFALTGNKKPNCDQFLNAALFGRS